MIKTVPTSNTANKVVFTGKVPGEGGTLFFCARLPASAMAGIIMRNLPMSMSQPIAMLYHQFVPRPANADPLLPAPETNEYKTSLKPCGPGFAIDDCPAGTRTRVRRRVMPAPRPPARKSTYDTSDKIIAIGASTGGVEA